MTMTTEQLFDPAEHNVAEVLAYLERADDTERDRVLGAEKAGKDRSSVAAFGGVTDETAGPKPVTPADSIKATMAALASRRAGTA
jgi:hypothetical protein